MRLPTSIVWAAALAGCATPSTEAPAPQLEGVALRVELEQSRLHCENLLPERPVQFLAYERDAEREADGVYGLHDAKARMDVPTPLDGDPIAWPDVDAQGALIRLLTEAGAPVDEARALVERHHEEWFANGLRVLFVVADAAPPSWSTWPVVVAELR